MRCIGVAGIYFYKLQCILFLVEIRKPIAAACPDGAVIGYFQAYEVVKGLRSIGLGAGLKAPYDSKVAIFSCLQAKKTLFYGGHPDIAVVVLGNGMYIRIFITTPRLVCLQAHFVKSFSLPVKICNTCSL